MSETPKEKPKIEKDRCDEQDKASWSEDQEIREYYYDDAHGYEVYVPDEAENEESKCE